MVKRPQKYFALAGAVALDAALLILETVLVAVLLVVQLFILLFTVYQIIIS